MRKLILSAAFAGLLMSAPAFAATTLTPDQIAVGIAGALERIRRYTSLPIAVGFGISTRQHVHEIAAAADGVVVGSALVGIIQRHLDDRARIAPALAESAADLVAGTGRG